MPVPAILKREKSHVFCYSRDLIDASNRLAYYLGCEVSTVYDNKFHPDASNAKVAWLVGHGSKYDSKVYHKDADDGIKIGDISDWLLFRDYTHLVDTCCYPNMRRRYQKFNNDYYCTDDNECVTVITEYNSFDEWWDSSNMHQI